MKRESRLRVVTFLVLVSIIAILVIWFERAYGPIAWREVFSSRDSVRSFVRQFDPYGPIAFFVLQLTAVIFAPIPGNVVALAGGALFGLWTGFLLSTGALILGSSIAFGLARFYGRPLVERIVSKRIIDRYLDQVAERHFALLFGAFLLPFLPDDALCFVSGLSNLRYRVFLAMVVIGRPPGMFVANLVGAGLVVIPWWAWIIVAVASGALLYVLYRSRDRIEELIGSVTVPEQPRER
jgi:uncharacterized membrane protein YdjX (TVP38/TMEM64 family)